MIVQENRTLIVAGTGTGKTHTMVAKARDTVRSAIARVKEIAFVTFARKAAEEIRDRSGDLPGMEIGTIHHLSRGVIIQVEGTEPRLSSVSQDETPRLTELWVYSSKSVSGAIALDPRSTVVTMRTGSRLSNESIPAMERYTDAETHRGGAKS